MTVTRPGLRRPGPAPTAQAVEVAEAAALATLVAAVTVVDRLIPLGFAGFLLAAFPPAVLGVRHRARACVGAVVTATMLAFLGAGPGLAGKAFAAAAVGTLVGVGSRRGWSTTRTALVATLVPTLPTTALGTALLAVLVDTRRLLLAQVLDGARGLARVLGSVGAPPGLPEALAGSAGVVVDRWWLVLPVSGLVGGFLGAALTAAVFRRPLAHVAAQLPPVPRDLGALSPDPLGPVAPLPLRLRGVGVRRDGRRVLAGVDLELEAGRLVTVTGPNGAGKSTLGRVVAGLAPDEGAVERPGGAGLGRAGGTAMVFQRPESQVLGVRVGDDLRWGASGPVDVEALLARVGLAGDAERETDTLSGGELQRLALAAALARRPAVVVSDETTAMLDEPGRRAVVALLGELAAGGTAVLHVTHRRGEIDGAARRLALDGHGDGSGGGSGDGSGGGRDGSAPPVPHGGSARPGGAIVLRDVAVTHDAGTPWRRDVLAGVDLAIPAGHTVLITGPNGAGKSTLAWVLAGLAPPSAGTATLDGAPLRNGRHGALLGVQHARLSLLRATVGQDVRDAAGVGQDGADAALAAVGLAAEEFRDRSTDALSGGEARRVLLAGLLATGAPALVLDEPLAGLDDGAVAAVTAALTAVRAAGTTLVITTHDAAPLAGLADATVTVEHGTVVAPAELRPAPVEDPRARRPRPARRSARRVGRTLPHPSPASRLRAGTKLGVLVALVVALGVAPHPATLVAGAAVLAGWSWLGRMPAGAWPRPPGWLVVGAAVLLLLVALGGAPDITVLGLPISLAGMGRSVLLLAAAVLTLSGSVLFVATTPVGSLPPLLRNLAARLRRTRLPVDEWAVTAALGLRLAPSLVEQARIVRLVLGQRRRSRAPERRTLRERWHGADTAIVGVAALACATALRRAAETADALVARGGVAAIPADEGRSGVRRADVVAILGALAVLSVGIVVTVVR